MDKIRRAPNKGIIALTTLMISTILLILIVTLLISLKDDKYSALQMNSRAEMEYIAEAGIADATMQLSKANNWAPTTPVTVDLPDGAGTYSIVFNTSGTPAAHESVNNLANTGDRPGPNGQIVRGRTVHLVVTVTANNRTETYEVLLSRGFSRPVSVPLLTSGNIKITGALNVQGVPTPTNPNGPPSGIHSNNRDNLANIITWQAPGGEQATINGSVSVASIHPNAITAGSDFVPDSVDTAAGSKQFPLVDVDLAVLAGRWVPDVTVNPGGTTTVSGGDRKFAGGTINGDLELDGVNLFVDGDLEVNGTIRGTGAVYVKGNTFFRGTAELGGSDSDVLALFSKGHVSLTGFRGSQYLEDLSTDAGHTPFGDMYNDATFAYDELTRIFGSSSNYTIATVPDPGNVDKWGNLEGSVVDRHRATLGDDSPLTPGLSNNTLGRMANYLDSNFPTDESAQFMVTQLNDARPFYQNKTDSSNTPAQIIDNFKSGGSLLGALDAINDGFDITAASNSSNAMADLSFEEIGKSYFRGIVYTTGGVYAANEVEIVGALLAEKRGNSPSAPLVVTRHNGSTASVGAGDVVLEGGTTLIYHEELMQDPFAGSTFGPIVISAWLGN